MKKFLLTLLIGFFVWYLFFRNEEITLGPGVMAPDSPIQTGVSSAESFRRGDYTITPLADFHIKAKVLSRKTYCHGREADLSPIDLALGWGNMSDESVLEQMKIWQSNRWYRWRVDDFPIPRREIETHSANMHVIPASDWIQSRIADASKGAIVEFTGHLVRVDGDDGWYWISSLKRDDVGNHSCEVVWVEEFFVHEY